MLIRNVEVFNNNMTFYFVNNIISIYFQKLGIPIFSIGENGYYYAKNKTTDEAIKNLPYFQSAFGEYKIMGKGGEKIG